MQGTDGGESEAAAAAVSGAQAGAGGGGGGGGGGANTNAHKRQRADDATVAVGGVLAPDPSVAGAAQLYGKPWTWPIREELLQQQQAGTSNHRSGHGAQGPQGPHAHGRRPPSLLHDEVVAFARESAPGERELRQLQAALAAVQRVASSMWPSARVVLFGSQVGSCAS